MTRVCTIALSIALAVLSFALPTGARAQTTELIFNAYLPPMNPTRKVAIEDFAKRIMAESKDSIKVTIPDASLAPSDRQYEMVMDGIADMAIVSTSSMRQLVTLNRIADLPFAAPSAEAASVALWETYKEYFEARGEWKGVKLLSTHVLFGRGLLSAKSDPIDGIEKFKGLKIWTPAGALSEVANKLGAVSVQSEFTQLFEYVSKGTVDAMFVSPGSALQANVLNYVKSTVEIPGGLGSASFAVFISDSKWRALNKEQQDAVLRAAEGLPRRTGVASDGFENAAINKMTGVNKVTPSPAMLAELQKFLNPQIEAWKKQAAGKGLAKPDEVLDFYHAALAAAVKK